MSLLAALRRLLVPFVLAAAAFILIGLLLHRLGLTPAPGVGWLAYVALVVILTELGPDLLPWLRAPPRHRNRRGVRGAGHGMTQTSGYKVTKTDEQWREELSQEEYQVLRRAGTERPWSGEYNDTKTEGVYTCRACDAELFRSDTKFDSHCGWPSFYAPSSEDNVELHEDRSMGMKRVEVLCRTCGSHLGHVFEDAPQTPTGDRYCMNSVSLKLVAKE